MPDFPLGVTMGMLLSLPMLILGLWMIWRTRTKTNEAAKRHDRTRRNGRKKRRSRERLIELIKLKGPITVADYMADALGHPT